MVLQHELHRVLDARIRLVSVVVELEGDSATADAAIFVHMAEVRVRAPVELAPQPPGGTGKGCGHAEDDLVGVRPQGARSDARTRRREGRQLRGLGPEAPPLRPGYRQQPGEAAADQPASRKDGYPVLRLATGPSLGIACIHSLSSFPEPDAPPAPGGKTCGNPTAARYCPTFPETTCRGSSRTARFGGGPDPARSREAIRVGCIAARR